MKHTSVFYGTVAIGIVVVILLVALISTLVPGATVVDEQPTPSDTPSIEEQTPVFTWRFAEANTTNPDGGLQTQIFLTTTYEAEEAERLIDTVDGSCSELLDETDDGAVSQSVDVSCYYAGLGQRYRIVTRNDSYVVERKLFEEALPDVAVRTHTWEVIATLR